MCRAENKRTGKFEIKPNPKGIGFCFFFIGEVMFVKNVKNEAYK